jgi:putative spermidine/putrescine transport system ATP-binding protein
VEQGNRSSLNDTAYLSLRGIKKRYGSREVVCGIDLDVARGELLCLLGPSGCGKTTTLNLIAGFIALDEGSISVGGKPVQAVPAYRRNMGMVFQNYALFPHLTVFENIAFGLRLRKLTRGEIEQRVRNALALTHMDHYGGQLPRQLSGGQQQRVALARALVIEPTVLLLDEPFSNLDAKLRRLMREEVLEIQRRVGITTIFVTHDQEEALAISDRIAVLREGHIEDVNSPLELYRRPRSGFVASFIGDVNVVGDTYVRPEALRLRLAPDGDATIEAVTFLGARKRYRLRSRHAGDLVAETPASEAFSVGDRVAVEWDPADATTLQDS